MPKTDSGNRSCGGGWRRELKLWDFLRSEAAAAVASRSDDVGVDLKVFLMMAMVEICGERASRSHLLACLKRPKSKPERIPSFAFHILREYS